MTTLAVLTSGGDAPGMNTAIRAMVKAASERQIRVVGVLQGYDGLMNGEFVGLSNLAQDASMARLLGEDIDRIGGFGGTVLGSARSRRFIEPEGRAQAAQQLRDQSVDALIVIGGNGSLTGAHAFAQEHGIPVVGVPASIDNDIGCTSTAIGVDTALNTIVWACDHISDTARAHHRAFVVEVMGRDCGYLAMASAIAASADAALFREQGRTESEVIAAVDEAIRRGFSQERRKRRVLIIKSEGVKVPCQSMVETLNARLADTSPRIEVRGSVLGHVVRGGAPTYGDRMVAGRLALAAVDAALSGVSDQMVAWQPEIAGGHPTVDPAVVTFPLADVLKETEALLDGSSVVTQGRVRMMERVQGVLGL